MNVAAQGLSIILVMAQPWLGEHFP